MKNDCYVTTTAAQQVRSMEKSSWGSKQGLTLTDTKTNRSIETDKTGLYKIVWRCSHCTKTTMPLITVVIYRSWYRSRSLLV